MSVVELEKVYVIGNGCENCRYTGIVGCTVVVETVVSDDKLLSLIRQRDKLAALTYWRNELRGLTMKDYVLVKIIQGMVDLFQVEVVVGCLSKMDDILHYFA